MKQKHVLLLTDAYPPEVRSSATLMRDMARWFSRQGWRVTVITCKPKYNLPDSDSGVDAADRLIRVVHVPAPPIHKVHPVIRGLGEMSLAFSFAVAGLMAGPATVSICYSPPLTLGLACYFLRLLRGVPFIINIQDIFPKYAIDVGVLKNPLIIRFFEMLERFLYRRSGFLTVHSDGNKKIVIARGARADKVTVVHNWVDFDSLAGEPCDLVEKLGLTDKFVLLFGGVLGYQQDLDAILECARLVRQEQDIRFLILGNGSEKSRLQEKALALQLDNVIFCDFVSQEQYWDVVRKISVGLVSLRSSVGVTVVPSKMIGYMACAKPVIASINPASDAAKVIEESSCGYVCDAGDPEPLAKAVLELYRDPQKRASAAQKGLKYAREFFSQEHAMGTYDQLIADLDARRKQQH